MSVEPRLQQEIVEEFDARELGEFLAPERRAAPVDPAFREGLRKKLWTLVAQRDGREADDRLD